ncbi:MAG: dihydrodipicolinate synthase family protein [Oscillospiraceae bacterium]|nr:dihydrodipicolinate synthase family protein [Oscillospiraceae bacterium]
MNINKMKQAFTGPVASITTPFTRNGDVDYSALCNMVEFFIAAGSPAMLLTYGDSLYSILTDDEITNITWLVAEQTAGRSSVVACSRWVLPKTLEFADTCNEWGIDGLLLYPPDWAGSCTGETLSAYYTAVAERIPIILMTASIAGPLPLKMISKFLDSGIDIIGI